MHSVLPYPRAREKLSLVQKVGQLFMPAAFINDNEEEVRTLERLIADCAIGSICFFHSRASAATNFEGKKKVVHNADSFARLKKLITRYQNAAPFPLLIAMDAEWGLAMRIENTPQYPYAITLGAVEGHSELLYEVGRQIAQDCKVAGIHWNLGPVVDINNNPDNPVIGYRSFGENRQEVLEKATAFIAGGESEGILNSVKHFPGHGDTATDSHLALPLITKTKDEMLRNELYPFQQLINRGVDSVMIGHLAVPALTSGKHISSSISKEIIKDLLRREMGFKGVVISDALNMHAVASSDPRKGELERLAFEAGNDVLCFSENVREGISAILQNGEVSDIEESFKRIWHLKSKAIPLPCPGTKLSDTTILNAKLASESLTLVQGTEEDIAKFRERGYQEFQIDKDHATAEKAEIEKWKKQLQSDHLLIHLTPPKVKPAHKFDISTAVLDLINGLILQKKVVLYLYGNPFALNLIPVEKAIAVVCAYQDFEGFRKNAVSHFNGEVRAKGKLPVTLQRSGKSGSQRNSN